MTIHLLNSDARYIPLSDQSVQCVITSPPYWGLRDYGVAGQIGLERTPQEYVASIVAVMREVWRVLKDDGTLWLNLGDSYAQNEIRHRNKESETSGIRESAGAWSRANYQAVSLPGARGRLIRRSPAGARRKGTTTR